MKGATISKDLEFLHLLGRFGEPGVRVYMRETWIFFLCLLVKMDKSFGIQELPRFRSFGFGLYFATQRAFFERPPSTTTIFKCQKGSLVMQVKGG